VCRQDLTWISRLINDLAKVKVAVPHISYHKSWNMVSKTDIDVVTALESQVENALGAVKLEC
jgi:hypothetical protein